MRPAPRFFQSLLYSAFAASFWSMPAHAVTILNTGNEDDSLQRISTTARRGNFFAYEAWTVTSPNR